MKVKFKDGNIVDAVQYHYREFDESNDFIGHVNRLIKIHHPTVTNLLGQYTVKHDNSMEVRWDDSEGTHSVLVPDGGYVYHNPIYKGIFALSRVTFDNHFLEYVDLDPKEPKVTSIQDDIKALEAKIAKHLQEIGAVSGEFAVAQQNVKFLAMYEVNVNDYWKFSEGDGVGKELTVDALIDQYKKEPWKFGKKGGNRG